MESRSFDYRFRGRSELSEVEILRGCAIASPTFRHPLGLRPISALSDTILAIAAEVRRAGARSPVEDYRTWAHLRWPSNKVAMRILDRIIDGL